MALCGHASAQPLPPKQQSAFRLANGLRVVLVEDPLTPEVAVYVAYDAGTAHEPRQYRGLAHLVEHLAFRNSRHLTAVGRDAALKEVGARFNAYTALEHTVYHTTLAPRGLETALWIESERMAFTLDGIDQATLDVEKKVVENELRERTRRMDVVTAERNRLSLYGENHPFAPGEDEIGDVDAVELRGVQWFFQSVYRPDNATLVVVGNFRHDAGRALVEKYFGGIVSPKVPRLTMQAPPPKLCGAHRQRVLHGFVVGRRALVTWILPAVPTPAEQASMDVLMQVLKRRLNDALVAPALAASIGVGIDRRRTHGLFGIEVDLYDAPKWKNVEDMLMAESRRLATEAVPAAELEAVRTELRSHYVFARDDAPLRAEAVLSGTDLEARSAALDTVNAASVIAVARPFVGPSLYVRFEPGQREIERSEVAGDENPCAGASK